MIRNLLDNAWIDNRIKKEKIVHEVYINYEKQLMFIGRANMEENICVFYAFECFLDRENVEEATKHILNWDYYTRKGVEDYFNMEFDRGIATLDAIDSIRG